MEAAAAAPAANKEPAATAVGDIRETLPGMTLMPVAPVAAQANGRAGKGAYFNEKPLATPATRALARELGVDLRAVPPTGPNGRVTKDDVRALGTASAPMTQSPPAVRAPHVARPEAVAEESAPAPRSPAPRGSDAGQQPSPATTRQAGKLALPPATAALGLEERIPLRGMRKRIFEGMTRSKHTAAHFTFVEECDVGALKDLRARLRPAAEKAGVKLTFLPFFVKAVVAALKRHPTLNAAFDESTQEIVVRRYYDIGIASATEAGPDRAGGARRRPQEHPRRRARHPAPGRGDQGGQGPARRTWAAPPSPSPRWASRAGSSRRRSSTSPRWPSWASTR